MTFKCHHPGCKRDYKRREHLLRHQKDHSNLRAFACHACPSAFNRRDLLNRHLIISHGAPRKKPRVGYSKNNENEKARHGPDGKEGDTNTENGSEFHQHRTKQLGVSILYDLGAELIRALNKELLQERYFREFHPHWPILHQYTFQSKSQPVELVEAVMVAGLWMMNTSKTKQLAECLHDRLDYKMRDHLGKFNYDRQLLKEPPYVPLAVLQTFMITMILFTYRGARFYPKTVVDNKRLFRLFDYCGALDQKRIDTQSDSDWLSREQYQRLALVLFKVFVHINGLLLAHLPGFTLLDYFDPSMLKVRVPSPKGLWDTETVDPIREVEDVALIESLFTGNMTHHKYSMLASIAAWDFSTGTIIGWYTRRKPGETLIELMEKIKPFLFWHLEVRAGN